MVSRRELLGSGILGGALGTVAAPHVEAGQPSGADVAAVDRVAREVRDLRDEIRLQREFPEIAPVRTAQIDFLRANHKFPDFIELGTTHWFNVYDWHVRWQQPITQGRDASGRAYILLMQTALILRPDATPTFMSQPFDSSRAPAPA
jgi:hypothetical protein